MKELFLMRHGKSSWKDEDLDDFDRPLNKRGKRDALFMAEFLAGKKLLPDLILASPAIRARQTTERLNEVFKLNEKIIRYYDDFYLADQQDFFDALNLLDDTFLSVMIIGHNPSLEYFIHSLTGEVHKFPTAAVAQIKLSVANWKDLRTTLGCGKLINLWRPKELQLISAEKPSR